MLSTKKTILFCTILCLQSSFSNGLAINATASTLQNGGNSTIVSTISANNTLEVVKPSQASSPEFHIFPTQNIALSNKPIDPVIPSAATVVPDPDDTPKSSDIPPSTSSLPPGSPITSITPPSNSSVIPEPLTSEFPITSNANISTTHSPSPAPPIPHRQFDGASFIGGIILTTGLLAISFVAFKFYNARTERNYLTL